MVIPPDLQAQAALDFVEARYLSGANPLQEGQTTRVSITYRVRNPLNVPLDYTGTAVIDFGGSVGAVSATASTGTTSVSPPRVTWDGFVLAPGGSATITVVADITPSAPAAGAPVVVVAGTLTTARTAMGGVVNVRGGPVDSTAVQGLLNGGFVIARAPAAAPTAAAPAAGAAAGAAPAGAVTPAAPAGAGTGGPGPAVPAAAQAARPAAAPPAGTLPRTGTGLATDHDPGAVDLGVAALGLAGLIVAGALIGRRRARG